MLYSSFFTPLEIRGHGTPVTSQTGPIAFRVSAAIAACVRQESPGKDSVGQLAVHPVEFIPTTRAFSRAPVVRMDEAIPHSPDDENPGKDDQAPANQVRERKAGYIGHDTGLDRFNKHG